MLRFLLLFALIAVTFAQWGYYGRHGNGYSSFGRHHGYSGYRTYGGYRQSPYGGVGLLPALLGR